MKRKVLAMLVPALLVAGAANAAEIIIKMAINWICTEKLILVILFPITLAMTAMKLSSS